MKTEKNSNKKGLCFITVVYVLLTTINKKCNQVLIATSSPMAAGAITSLVTNNSLVTILILIQQAMYI